MAAFRERNPGPMVEELAEVVAEIKGPQAATEVGLAPDLAAGHREAAALLDPILA